MNGSGSECHAPEKLENDIRQLLGKLASRGAYLKLDVKTQPSARYCAVVTIRDRRCQPIFEMPLPLVEEARRRGLLQPGKNSDEWRLSARGARALRMARSAGDGVGVPEKPCGAKKKTKIKIKSKEKTRVKPDPDARPANKTPKNEAEARINEAESPLGWLRRRKGKDGSPWLSDAQFDAGEKLRADFWLGQMTPQVTSDWSCIPSGCSKRRSGPGAGAERNMRVMAARERVRTALDAVGPELAGVLVDVCCHLKGLEMAEHNAGWPQRSGKVVLLLALSALARHYGFVDHLLGHAGRAGKTSHWGTVDYRPLFDDD